MPEHPERWGSALGFVLAAAGSAVGLGNLWGFAYRASQGGGAAFVLLYVLIVAVVCLPVLVGWVAPQRLQADLAGCGSSVPLQRLLLVALRWVSPLAIAVGLAVSIGDLLQSWPGQG